MGKAKHKSNDLCDVNGCDEKVDVVINTGLHRRDIGACIVHGSLLKKFVDDSCAKVGVFLVTGDI